MPPDATPLLDASGVDAGYGTMQVLWNVDLDVRAGETVLLFGTNGAGKTTFLKSLVGLVDAGRAVTLGGHGPDADPLQRSHEARHDLHVRARGVP